MSNLNLYVDSDPRPKEWVARREDNSEICRGDFLDDVIAMAALLGEHDPILSMEAKCPVES